MPNLFLDSDGVLYDFDTHVINHTGSHPSKLGDETMWKLVDAIPDFWLTMPMFPWTLDLIEFAMPYNPVILSGCPKTNYDVAAKHKVEKYAKQFPGLPVITCLSKNKPEHMIEKGDILLDDRHSNIKRWHKAGGKAILFRTYEQALAELKVALR